MSNKWISVKDRLPDKDFLESGKTYLVCSSSTVCLTTCIFTNNKWLTTDKITQQITDITHWMPLPELPKKLKGGSNA